MTHFGLNNEKDGKQTKDIFMSDANKKGVT